MALQAVSADYGISDKRVRRHNTSQQERCCRRVTEQGYRHYVGEYQRDKARKQSEKQEPPRVFLYALHIHLESGKEHDVVKTYPAEELERVVANKNIESILADGDTRKHHTDDMRNTQFTHHDRSKQNNQQNHKKDKSWVCNRQI